MPNADPLELDKFSQIAHRWWDPSSEFKALHAINPLRADWIDRHVGLAGKKALDLGCGGGLLSESLAQRGANVTGIDLSEPALEVAKLHLLESGSTVDYRLIAAEELAQQMPNAFDVVACMEMLEHVPDPASVVAACAALCQPGGQVFFSTLNRHPKSCLLAILGAEYLFRLLPRGTHEYARFIKPSELSRWARSAGLEPEEAIGLAYNPLSGKCRLCADLGVNYLMRARKPV